MLESIDAHELPQIEVYNKIDRTGDEPRVDRDEDGRPARIWLSAHTGAGVNLLHAALHEALGTELVHCLLRLPPSKGRARARLFAAGAVLDQRPLEDGWLALDVSLRRLDLERICREEGVEFPAETAPCAAAEPFLQSDRLTAVS